MSDTLKAEVERKANELIETALTPKYVQPPPKNPKFNYVIGLSTKWHGRYFYLLATYACPGPSAISPRSARFAISGIGLASIARTASSTGYSTRCNLTDRPSTIA